MKGNVSMITAVLAIIISIIAIASAVVIGPVSTIGTSTIGENELANNSVTSDKVVDGALTDNDISGNGISKIADNAITLLHLSSEVIDAMTGETTVSAAIADDSVTSAMIVNGTITDDDINDTGISKISDNAITLAHLTAAVIDAMTGVTGIADNSITSSKITDGTISNVDISDSADIAPSKINGTAWTATNDGSDSGLDADKLDGIEGIQYLRNDASGTINGDLIVDGISTVDSVSYSSPRTHYYIVGSEGFVPGSNEDYTNTYGQGGAYVDAAGSHALVAPVHLPQGAEVTEFEVFFYSTSGNDMSVNLMSQNMNSGGFTTMAEASSSGISGYESRTDTTISSATIYNTLYSYLVYAYSAAWDGNNMRIKGALITYTIDEAL